MQYILLAAQDGAEFDERGDRLRKERGKSGQGVQYWTHSKNKKPQRSHIYKNQHQPFQRFPTRNIQNTMLYRNLKKPQYLYWMSNPNSQTSIQWTTIPLLVILCVFAEAFIKTIWTIFGVLRLFILKYLWEALVCWDYNYCMCQLTIMYCKYIIHFQQMDAVFC